MSVTTNRAPSRAKSSAVARPMPNAAPVITADLPRRRPNPWVTGGDGRRLTRTPQPNQRDNKHLVETGQQVQHLEQPTAPVVPDRGDDNRIDQRQRDNGLDAHGPGLYSVPSTL